MNNSTAMSWHETNQAYLVKALRSITGALERHSGGGREKDLEHRLLSRRMRPSRILPLS